MTIWHAPAAALTDFATDPESVEPTVAASLELHLLQCNECRAVVAAAASPFAAAASWDAVADRIDRPKPSLVERLLRRLGVTDTVARLVGATRPLQVAWLAAMAAVVALAVLAAQRADDAGPFLVIAPLVPLAAVALAFRAGAEPAGEAGAVAPVAGVGLVLRRAVAVVGATLVLLIAGALGVARSLVDRCRVGPPGARPELGRLSPGHLDARRDRGLGPRCGMAGCPVAGRVRRPRACARRRTGTARRAWAGGVRAPCPLQSHASRGAPRHVRNARKEPMMANTVNAADLVKRYGATVALAGVGVDIGPGVTGLLGPNGAGKTTLLRIAATVLAPDAGEVRIFDLDPGTGEGRLAIRRRLGYMPQEPGFHQGFTAFDFVDYVAILKEWTDRRSRHDEVRRVLSLVGLETLMHKRIRALSGGMRRRVAIAQAFLGAPDLLLLDEPTAGLDPEQRLRFRELLGAHAGGATIVLSTHQTDDVAALCQHVIVLLAGRVCFAGTPADLAAIATDRVWLADERDPRAALAWVTSEGKVRHIGEPPTRAKLATPTVEDGYLLLSGAAGRQTAVA